MIGENFDENFRTKAFRPEALALLPQNLYRSINHIIREMVFSLPASLNPGPVSLAKPDRN